MITENDIGKSFKFILNCTDETEKEKYKDILNQPGNYITIPNLQGFEEGYNLGSYFTDKNNSEEHKSNWKISRIIEYKGIKFFTFRLPQSAWTERLISLFHPPQEIYHPETLLNEPTMVFPCDCAESY